MITFADNAMHARVCFAFSNGTFLCHAMNIHNDDSNEMYHLGEELYNSGCP